MSWKGYDIICYWGFLSPLLLCGRWGDIKWQFTTKQKHFREIDLEKEWFEQEFQREIWTANHRGWAKDSPQKQSRLNILDTGIR